MENDDFINLDEMDEALSAAAVLWRKARLCSVLALAI